MYLCDLTNSFPEVKFKKKKSNYLKIIEYKLFS